MEKKRCEYHVNSKKKSSIAKSISEEQNPTIAWKPKGQLVAHLHEHQVYSQITSDICMSSSTLSIFQLLQLYDFLIVNFREA